MKFKLKGIFVKSLLIMLAISFVMFGIINFFSGVGVANIAKVDDEKISTNKFIKYLNNKRNEFYQSEMNENDTNFFNSREFVNLALSEFINEILIQKEIKKLNIQEPREFVLENIYNDNNFKKDNGKFDVEKFEYFLQKSGLNEDSYIQYISSYQTRNNLLQLITSQNLSNKYILKFLFKKDNQYRVVDIIEINADDLKFENKNISENEITKYYDNNKKDFLIPEEKVISFIDINLSNYKNEEAKNKLSKLEDLILSSRNIDEISKEFNINKNYIIYSKNSIDLPKDLSIEFTQYNEGTFSDLIYKDNNLYRIYYIEKITPSKMLTLNEAKPKIQEILLKNEKKKNDELILDKLILQMRNNGVNKIAVRNSFKVKENEKIFENDFNHSDEIVNSTYSLKRIDSFSKPIYDSESNIYIIVKLNKIDELNEKDNKFVQYLVVENKMNRSYKNSTFKLFGKYLIDSNKVIINQKVLNSLQ